ncbi:phospholipid scramblase 1-like [Saccoglossus kowalevskii]
MQQPTGYKYGPDQTVTISSQPGTEHKQGGDGLELMQRPSVLVADCPPGLEYLTQIDQILVFQKVELAEVCCGCEFQNSYTLCNNMGQQIYKAKEGMLHSVITWVSRYIKPRKVCYTV